MSGKLTKILWLGPMASDEALAQRAATNQAAANWTRGLLGALREGGCAVRAVSHCRERLWPRGELWPGRKEDFVAREDVRFSGYLNLPLVRDGWLAGTYRRMVRRELERNRPDVVLLYNLDPCHMAVTGVLNESGVAWMPVILDHDDPREDGWRSFADRVNGARGVVFVSDWAWRGAPLAIPKLRFEGGIRVEGRDSALGGRRRIVYSGKYNDRFGGTEFLFSCFEKVRDKDCELVLTGKDQYGLLRRYLEREPRARYMGHLSWEELERVYSEAFMFINPGDPEVSDNRMNFPSKLLDYLPWGRPVVSSWSPGISNEYREVLTVPAEYTPEAYAEVVEGLLRMEEEEWLARGERQRRWCEERTWERQADRLLEWVNEICF